MSEDDLIKIIIGLTSAFSGWLLAQLTIGLKALLQRRKIKELLYEELSDIDREINRLYFFYARQLEVHGAQCIGSETAAGLSNPIFKGYYKDALLSLNQQQRISYQLIHALVDQVNIGIVEFRELTSEAHNLHRSDGMSEEIRNLGEAWGKKAMVEFQSCAALQWQVRYHRENKNGPDLSPYTEDHEAYLKYLKAAQEKADEFIDNGKTIDREKFDQIYDSHTFKRANS